MSRNIGEQQLASAHVAPAVPLPSPLWSPQSLVITLTCHHSADC